MVNDMGLDKEFQKKAAVKLLIIAVLLIFSISLIKDTAVKFYEEMAWSADSSRISMYERYLNNGDYNGLRASMVLFQSYDEIYDPYWEIADAYNHLSEYKVWHMAYQKLEKSDGEYENRMKESKEKLLKLCGNSEFDKNKKILESFAEQIK